MPGPRAASGRTPRRPRNKGENKTVLASLSLAGVGPTMRFDGPMTTDRFEGYVRHVLAPTLRPGQIVVADNLRAHHSERARAAIEARGAHFWHLPPYSPDFNPIEEAFSKVKQFLRRARARTDDALRSATWAALAAITPADIAGWFSHCGYGPGSRVLRNAVRADPDGDYAEDAPGQLTAFHQARQGPGWTVGLGHRGPGRPDRSA